MNCVCRRPAGDVGRRIAPDARHNPRPGGVLFTLAVGGNFPANFGTAPRTRLDGSAGASKAPMAAGSIRHSCRSQAVDPILWRQEFEASIEVCLERFTPISTGKNHSYGLLAERAAAFGVDSTDAFAAASSRSRATGSLF